MTQDKNKIELPVLQNYLSATQYLQDIYIYRKSQNPGFSYDAWAAEMGFKSRSFVKMLIHQQRTITESSIEAISQSLNFNESDKAYFTLLVNYSQAGSHAEKTFYQDKLFAHVGENKDFQEIREYSEFLSSPDLPKLQVLLSFADLEKTVSGLAKFLSQPPAKVLENLQKLEELKVAQSEFNSELQAMEWKPTKKSFKVPKNFGCEALENYHNQCLLEAIDAQKMPAHLRRYRSVLVPLSQADYENLVAEVNALVNKTLAKYDSETLLEKRLYKMNLNMIPVTEVFAQPDEPFCSQS
ncbi:TIGR02147 family protein [Bdellovibrio sp. HCB337]|uniref:TIGR02147 family protein n=1 Tax=Bdellovibrio sp. HCB337 TaxID=3394358 RepID=UPI0039A6E801